MCAFSPPIRLLRYLLVFRVNSSLVRLPRCLSLELSVGLGGIIAERLPTHEARHWRKALSPWQGYTGDILSVPVRDASTPKPPESSVVPDVSWPIKAMVYAYPGKQMYGRGEPILWELKLMGESADHGLFLEWILPALEEAGATTDAHWNRVNTLWGHFDMDAIYVARGVQWEPLVQDGRLDLRYQPTPTQWAEGQTFAVAPAQPLRELTWLTPFAFASDVEAPGLWEIMKATEARVHQVMPGRHGEADEVGEIFADGKSSWQEVLSQAKEVSVQSHKLKPAPKYWPGDRIGSQRFSAIPPEIVPYLNVAAILHVGQYTHFGCGTFALTG